MEKKMWYGLEISKNMTITNVEVNSNEELQQSMINFALGQTDDLGVSALSKIIYFEVGSKTAKLLLEFGMGKILVEAELLS